VIETKDLHHVVGSVNPVQVDNLYFMGNAGGFIGPMLGFGSMSSMISGATAANCMINGLDYNVAMKSFKEDIQAKYELRKMFNTFDNDAMDLFCTVETLPAIKQFIFNNPLLKATYGTMFVKAYNNVVKSNPEIVNQEIEPLIISCKRKLY
jgi:digeranylgeranylglycerophospholipid reductase